MFIDRRWSPEVFARVKRCVHWQGCEGHATLEESQSVFCTVSIPAVFLMFDCFKFSSQLWTLRAFYASSKTPDPSDRRSCNCCIFASLSLLPTRFPSNHKLLCITIATSEFLNTQSVSSDSGLIRSPRTLSRISSFLRIPLGFTPQTRS